MWKLLLLLPIMAGCAGVNVSSYSDLGRDPDSVVSLYKNLLRGREYDKSYFLFNSEFQDYVDRSLYNWLLPNFYVLKEFILSLQLVKSEELTSTESLIYLKSSKYGIDLDLKVIKYEKSKYWVFNIDKNEINLIIKKFWKWYDLQLESAQYQRHVYPKNWNYEGQK